MRTLTAGLAIAAALALLAPIALADDIEKLFAFPSHSPFEKFGSSW